MIDVKKRACAALLTFALTLALCSCGTEDSAEPLVSFSAKSSETEVTEETMSEVTTEATTTEEITTEEITTEATITEVNTTEATVTEETTTEATTTEITAAETAATSETTEMVTSAETTEAALETSSEAKQTITVILNTSTKCFHIDKDCRAAKKIKDENRSETTVSDIEEIKAQGYDACGICAKAYK